MKKAYRILAILLCLSMLFALAACSAKQENTTEDQKPDETVTETTDTAEPSGDAPASEEAPEEMTLSVAWWGGAARNERIEKTLDLYSELNPNVTLKYAFFSVPLKLIFSLLVALLLLRSTKLTPIYRGMYYLPSIMGASVAVSVLWKQLFGNDGVINHIFGTHISWLGSPSTAIWVLILLSVWQFGSSMLIFLSAMKQIPQELYEAARVDGAGPVKQFFTITLPLLTSTIFFNLIMQMINGMLVFAQGQIITAGKPMDSTLFYVLYLYNQAFKFNNMGYASAMGWIMIAIIAILTGILFGTKKLWVYEGGY